MCDLVGQTNKNKTVLKTGLLSLYTGESNPDRVLVERLGRCLKRLELLNARVGALEHKVSRLTREVMA